MTDTADQLLADQFDPPVIRRSPESPPPFDCVGCKREIRPGPWDRPEESTPPFCRSCLLQWSSVTRLGIASATRGDMRRLVRLSAGINMLQWEVRNGCRTL